MRSTDYSFNFVFKHLVTIASSSHGHKLTLLDHLLPSKSDAKHFTRDYFDLFEVVVSSCAISGETH